MDIGAKKTIDDTAGTFTLELLADGVYISVTQADTENNISLNFISQYIQKIEIVENVDVIAIKKAIDEIGQNVRVADIKKPSVEVRIMEDEMSATARIVGQVDSGKFPKEEVLQELNKAGVVYGIIDDEVVQALIHPGNTFIIAVGKTSANGVDAEIKFSHKDEDDQKGPKDIEGGRVDFKELGLFSSVSENEILAEKIPLTKGEAGSTVTGKVLKCIDGKDKRIKIGKNVKIEENLYIAKIAGQLLATADKIDVAPVLEFKDDIDLSTGNVSFPGSIVVRGNIQSGFEVKAQGNITVHGNIYGGTVEGRIIEVRHGIQGGNNAYVKATESVVAKFIENAVVYAGENITVSDAILHSKISAGRKVLTTGSKGVVSGGYVSAGEEINLKTIGTPMAPPTTIEVGVSPMLKEEYVNLRASYKEDIGKLDGIKKSLTLLKPNENAVVPANRLELYTKLIRNNYALMENIEEMRNRISFIEREFENLVNGKIKCSGSIYPGVKLIINNIIYPIRDTFQYSAFYADKGEVKFSPYS